MKKQEFIFDEEKQIVVDSLMNGVIKDNFFKYVRLFDEDAIYGRVSRNKNKIYLYHGTLHRRNRPVFSAKIIEKDKTIISGAWRLSIYTNIFFFVWYLFLICISILPLTADVEGNLLLLYTVVFAFAALGALSIILEYRVERDRMRKVIEYIEKTQKDLNEAKDF